KIASCILNDLEYIDISCTFAEETSLDGSTPGGLLGLLVRLYPDRIRSEQTRVLHQWLSLRLPGDCPATVAVQLLESQGIWRWYLTPPSCFDEPLRSCRR